MSDGAFQTVMDEEEIPPSVYIDLIKQAINKCEDLKQKPMTGIEKIAKERLEQKTTHNHTIKSDWEQYPDFELTDAAVSILKGSEDYWPIAMDVEAFKKISRKEYEERLVIAGALIAAEIDRLNFTE